MNITKTTKRITVQRNPHIGRERKCQAGSTRSSTSDCEVSTAVSQAGRSTRATGQITANSSPNQSSTRAKNSAAIEDPIETDITSSDMHRSAFIRAEMEQFLFNASDNITRCQIETIMKYSKESEGLLVTAERSIAHLVGRLEERTIAEASTQRSYVSVAATPSVEKISTSAPSALRSAKPSRAKLAPNKVVVSSSSSADAVVVKTNVISML
ncbi:hypothetical protein WA026_021991 [Henosepilachna vigintioctopunctata]|uniref:Uncharacterized protein n=1 Tax=Henosepilachna vigintioctopunctata TaxID=420089 RepID=A0AAW1VJG4_9CUCU